MRTLSRDLAHQWGIIMADNDWQKATGNATRNWDCIENIYCNFDIGCSILYLTKDYELWCHALHLGVRKSGSSSRIQL